jgi:hypothetical protein
MTTPLEDQVHGRPGWSFAAEVASYAPARSGWVARVREVREPRRGAVRYHAAAIDPSGQARSTLTAYSVDEAVQWSEAAISRL